MNVESVGKGQDFVIRSVLVSVCSPSSIVWALVACTLTVPVESKRTWNVVDQNAVSEPISYRLTMI